MGGPRSVRPCNAQRPASRNHDLPATHQVSVTVIGDLDARVPHVARERLRYRRHYVATTSAGRRSRIPLSQPSDPARSHSWCGIACAASSSVVVRREYRRGLSRRRSRGSSPVARATRSPAAAGISSFRSRLRARARASGVALRSSAQGTSSTGPWPPGARMVERRDGRGDAIAEEQPAAPDAPRRKVTATRELVHVERGMPSSSATSLAERHRSVSAGVRSA
jgi:hypothetical protein